MLELNKFIDQPVLILTNDGRILVVHGARKRARTDVSHPFVSQGILNGYDQATNVILTSCHERIFSQQQGVVIVQLGLYLIRGDNMYMTGLCAVCGRLTLVGV